MEKIPYILKEDIGAQSFPYPFPSSQLVSEAAIDLDTYAGGRSTEIDSVRKLTRILKEYQLSDDDRINPSLFVRFYDPLRKAMREGSEKEIIDAPEMALEMRLLIADLEGIDKNPNSRQIRDNIIPFLCDYSRELGASMFRCHVQLHHGSLPFTVFAFKNRDIRTQY